MLSSIGISKPADHFDHSPKQEVIWLHTQDQTKAVRVNIAHRLRVDDLNQRRATSAMVNTIPAALGPFTNSPTETPTQRPQGASIGQGAARFIRPPPRIHRPTLLHHLLPRHSPVSSSSNSPSADPSSLRRNRAEGGSTNSAPAGSLPHPQSQSQTQPQADPSASQTQARSQALTPLPLVMPDTKLGSTTTRLLLQDTQVHMEKFAARMDALGTHMEQSLREIQMCRAATEGASEKCVADIVDVGE